MNEVLNKTGICGPKHHTISAHEFKGFHDVSFPPKPCPRQKILDTDENLKENFFNLWNRLSSTQCLN
jgi:hypothetical protein